MFSIANLVQCRSLYFLFSRLGVSLIALFLLTAGKVNSQPSFDLSQRNTGKLIAQVDRAQELLDRGSQELQAARIEQAIASWQSAAELYRQDNNAQGEALALGNIGLAYESLEDYLQAVQYFEQTLAVASNTENKQLEAGIQGNLGNNYVRLGNYPQAISAYDRSLSLWQQLNDRAAEGQVRRGMGNVQIALGNYEKAADLQQQALAIAQEFQDNAGIIYSNNSLGAIAANQGKYPQAGEYYQQSLKTIESLNNAPLKNKLTAQTLNNLASTTHASQEYDLALDYYQQSLAIAEADGLVALEGTIISGIGSVHLSLDNYAEGKKNLELGLLKAQSSGDRLLEAESLHNLGYAQWKLDSLESAEASFRQAIAIRESMREGLRDLDRVSLFDTQLQSYPLLRRVLIAQGKPEQALEVAEAERARSFVELLAARINPAAASSEAFKQQTAPPTIEQIKQIARQHNATLVEYAFIADDDFIAQGKLHGDYQQIYIWVVQPTGEVNFQQVDLTPQQAELVVKAGSWSSDWQNRTSTVEEDALFTSFTQLHQALYPLLIKPIVSYLPASADEQVIFLPQSELFQISFAALQDTNQEYLIDRHSILTAPAIQVLEFTNQQRQRLQNNSSNEALVVGNPVMPTEIITPGKSPTVLDLVALPGAEIEAQNIASILQTTQIIGQAASEFLIKQKMASARLVHLATHGLLNDFTNSGIPGAIALAPGSGEDGVLTSNEILDLKLNAELVVVSACDTGRGLVTRDGVVGLSRSLLAAGTPSVALSLWEIYDNSTAVLMQEFYRQLQDKNKAQALRLAMLKTKQEFPHPINWASFTLIGEAE